MNRREFLENTTYAAAVSLALGRSSSAAEADTIYVSAAAGTDANPGTKAAPLRTLPAAAKLVNHSRRPGPTTVILDEGVYAVNELLIWLSLAKG
jgi:hypothetical protein